MDQQVAAAGGSRGVRKGKGKDGALAAQAAAAAQAAEWRRWDQLEAWARNPRKNDGPNPAATRVAASIRRFGFVAPLVVWRRPDGTERLVAGHTRIKGIQLLLAEDAAFVPRHCPGPGMVPVRTVEFASEAEADAYALADNRLGEIAEWDAEGLAGVVKDLQSSFDGLEVMGWDEAELGRIAHYQPPAGPGGGRTMAEVFGAPPFTVLDARQGYWRDRKAQWRAYGVASEEGREHLGSTVTGKRERWIDRGKTTGGSDFDPVLAELVYKWFVPKGGHVLDPFAGEATKGIVAAVLGYGYTGVELREEQVQANRAQAERLGVAPEWRQGDSSKLAAELPAKAMYDAVFTSPPYYNLEVYSSKAGDGSAMPTYREFMEMYRAVFVGAVERLSKNRFLVVKIGDVRGKEGAYYNFLGDNITLFRSLGLHFYNEAVLVTPVGNMPLRAGMHFRAARKLERGHQNVLVFWKGNPKEVGKAMGPLPETAPLPEVGTEED